MRSYRAREAKVERERSSKIHAMPRVRSGQNHKLEVSSRSSVWMLWSKE